MNNTPNEKFKIHLKISEKRYPIWCLRSEKEEEIYRNAAANINGKLLMYSSKYPRKDLYDYLAMSAIHISAQHERIKKIHDKSGVFKKLEELTSKIDGFLKEND
ncbi:MAG: cell division protein ZapA [Bacteroidales bacterium]|jgi:cell division protein ZapA|nr:cell division protein ZapA [Bacteroidales bacterium]